MKKSENMSTASSIQERLQMKRVPLDDWSIREKLCLASAVLSSGDQNWMSVSRSLKMLCDSKRPNDWFSQKSCAAQYGKLLENVETPKRKKRSLSERDSSTPVETPGESIVRKLTQERITELKNIMQEEHQCFQKLKDDIVLLQNPNVSEQEIHDMWALIEEEKQQNEIEKSNHADWLKKREQRKLEIERAWRPGLIFQKNSMQMKQKTEEMDTDDNCSRSSGQSPLLTSLLKSPSTTPTSVALLQPTTTTTASNISSSNTSILNAGTPDTSVFGLVDILASQNSSPVMTNTSRTTNLSQSQVVTSQSISQSTPTLSMLLDKNSIAAKGAGKGSSEIHMSSQISQEADDDQATIDIFPDQIPSVESIEGGDANKNDEQLMDVFKGLIPDNIDELADLLTENNALLNPELLEEEEILDEVINQEEAQQNISKMDAFDQLKQETVIEERNRREAKAAAMGAGMGIKNLGNTIGLNISPEDSNQEDDIPLKVIQKDIIEANKAKELLHLKSDTEEAKDVFHELSSTSLDTSINLKVDEPKNLQDISTVSTSGIMNIAIKTEPTEDKMDLEFEDKPLPNTIKVKDEFEDSTDETVTSRKASFDEDLFEDTKDTMTPEKSCNQPELMIPDTDEESIADPVKEESKQGRNKRDYSRKKEIDTPIKSEDGDSRSGLRTRLRECDRSESPLIDDDSDNTPRTRRRFSSTPVSDSVPGSPSNVEDKELKAWRKLILLAYGRISSHKNATILNYLNKEMQEKKFKDIILRPMDMSLIKKNIENGTIKTTAEFQREIMLICINIMICSAAGSPVIQQAREMMIESIAIIKVTMEGFKDKEVVEKTQSASPATTNTGKRGGRKSLRGT